MENASLQADGFGCEVWHRAPVEWEPSNWILRDPAYGLNDAPDASHRSLQQYLLNSVGSLGALGLELGASSREPCLHFVFGGDGGAIGALTTHIDDILGRGEPDALPETGTFAEYRFETMKVQEKSFALVGMGLPQEDDFSVQLTREEFAQNLKPIPTYPEHWAARHQPL